MKIAIGLPTTGITKTDTTVCLMKLCAAIQQKYGSHLILQASGPVEHARNTIVDDFLKTDYTHLLFVDWDATFPENSAEILIDSDKDIIGANAAKKQTGKPVVENNIDGEPLNYIDHDIEQVNIIGMHVTMIKREVLESVPWPWFIPVEVSGERKLAGEDFVFCNKASKENFKVWVHNFLSIQVGHIADQILTLLPMFQKQMAEAKREQYTNELQKLKDNLHIEE
jgi:hypothetical protein